MFLSSLAVLMLPDARSAAQAEHSAPVANAINVIRAHHLDSPAGREAFQGRVSALFKKIDALNQETQKLGLQLMDPANRSRRPELLNSLQGKAMVVGPVLPILFDAKSLPDDFRTIDGVLAKAPPSITEGEKQMLLRVAKICSFLDRINVNVPVNP